MAEITFDLSSAPSVTTYCIYNPITKEVLPLMEDEALELAAKYPEIRKALGLPLNG